MAVQATDTTAAPAYNEDELTKLLQGTAYDSNKSGSFATNATNAWTNWLNQQSPTQLLSRYKYFSDKGVNDLGSYGQQKYGFGNANDATNYTAYKTFKDVIGRDATSGELAQILPAFQGPNGTMNGNAAIANLQQQYKSNPGIDPTSQQNTQKPADIQGQVNQQFQSILGRAPTADELSHFTQSIQTGQQDAYGLSSFLKQQPEYTNKQDATFRSGLNTELQNYDTTEFNKEKSGVMADYASRGFAPGNSPSLDYALTDLMGKIASNRSSYLAQLSASQYGGNKDLAIGNYQNSLNDMYNQNQQNVSSNRNYGQQLLNQGFQGADYSTQMGNYMNMLNQQPKYKPNAFDYLNTGANVARGVGSLVGSFNGGH